jgi:dTDP-4-dehydrorhamnose reductase
MSNLICIFGNRGQLATALRVLSEKAGLDIVCIGRAECDLNDVNRLMPTLESLKPAGVINAAAFTDVELAEQTLWPAMNVNATAVRTAADYCLSHDIPLVQISTDYTYDGQKGSPYVEGDPCRPLNVYGFSKLAGDHALLESAVRGTILRTSWVFSPYNRNFVNTMTGLALSRDLVRVVNDQRGNPTDARDLASAALAVLAALMQGNDLPRLLHFGGEPSVSWADLAEATFQAVEKHTGLRPKLERISSAEFPSKVLRPMDSRLDTSLFSGLGLGVGQDWQKSINDCVNEILAKRQL